METAPPIIKRTALKVGCGCNNNCRFCVIANTRSLGNLTTAKIFNELENARASGSRSVVFTGGEVTLRKDIFELVQKAREIGFEEIQLQTNGRMLAYESFVEKLVNAGATEFSPSLHGHTAEIHDYLTRSFGSFQQTLQGIRNVANAGYRAISNSVITVPNHRFLPELAELLINAGVAQFQLAFPHPLGNAGNYFDEIVPYKSQTAPFVHKALDLAKERGVPAMVEAFPFCFMQGYEEFCSEQYIPATEVRGIGKHTKDYEKARKTKGKLKGSKCPQCKHFQICEGPWKEYPQKRGWEEFKPVKYEEIQAGQIPAPQ